MGLRGEVNDYVAYRGALTSAPCRFDDGPLWAWLWHGTGVRVDLGNLVHGAYAADRLATAAGDPQTSGHAWPGLAQTSGTEYSARWRNPSVQQDINSCVQRGALFWKSGVPPSRLVVSAWMGLPWARALYASAQGAVRHRRLDGQCIIGAPSLPNSAHKLAVRAST